MGPILPEKASDYTFRKDRSWAINNLRNQSRSSSSPLSANALRSMNVYNSKTNETYNLYDEVKDFCVFDKKYGQEVLGLNNQAQYSLFMQCQTDADANHDGVFSEKEYADFKDKLKSKNVGILPNCATIEGLYPKQEDVKKSE